VPFRTGLENEMIGMQSRRIELHEVNLQLGNQVAVWRHGKRIACRFRQEERV